MRQDDQNWFDEVFRTTAPMLRRYVLSLYKEFPWLPNDPDDIVQEVFLCLYEKRNEIYNISDLPAWLIKTALYKTLALNRKQLKRVANLKNMKYGEEYSAGANSMTDADAADVGEYIALCEQRIGKRNLEIMREHYVDKRPIKYLAKREGVTTAAMHMRFHRWKRYCIQAIESAICTDLALIALMIADKM